MKINADEKPKVVLLFEALSQAEQTHFQAWLQLELGEKQQYLQKLAFFVGQRQGKVFPVSACWAYLYPDRPYDAARFHKLCRDLATWLEEYFAINAFRRKRGDVSLALLEELLTRDLHSIFVKTYRKVSRALEAAGYRDSGDFLRQFQIQLINNQFLSQVPAAAGRKPSQTLVYLTNLNEQLEHLLDTFWVVEKLNLRLNPRRDYTLDPFPLPELPEELVERHASVRLLKLAHELLETLELEKVETFAQALYLAESEFSIEVLRDLTLVLFNLYSRCLAQQPGPALKESMLELIDWGVENRILMTNGILPTPFYRNSISLSLRLGDIDRAFNYLEDLYPFVGEEEREEVYLFNYALLLFEKGDFKTLIAEMPTSRLDNPFYEINMRTILLQTHYELGTTERVWIGDQIDSLIRYLRKQVHLPDTYRQSYLLRLRFFRQLLFANNRQQLESLSQKVGATSTGLFDPRWILAKIHEQQQSLG